MGKPRRRLSFMLRRTSVVAVIASAVSFLLLVFLAQIADAVIGWITGRVSSAAGGLIDQAMLWLAEMLNRNANAVLGSVIVLLFALVIAQDWAYRWRKARSVTARASSLPVRW